MTQPVALAVGRTARTVLLLATALGLALMHTLGHTGVRVDVHPVPAGATVHVSDAAAMPVTLTPVDPCPDGHCDGHGSHGSGVWSACLAILAALTTAVVLLLALFAITRGHRSVPPNGDGRVRPPRAPPDRPTGLTLASAAVLRI